MKIVVYTASMAKKKTEGTITNEAEVKPENVVEVPAEITNEAEVKPVTFETGVIKTYVQNGITYRRFRNADGTCADMRS